MKTDFIPCSKLRREQLYPSFSLRCMNHCKMDIIAEELSVLGGFNLLVIGMTECSFYTHKLQFIDGLNLSYTLTDKELVLQDLEELEAVLVELEKDKRRTVVLETCIPSLMNLDIESLTDSDKFIFLKVPNYVGINSNDVLSLLYLSLFQNDLKMNPIDGITKIDSASFLKIVKASEVLSYKTYLVKEKKYYRLFKELGKKDNTIQVLDESHIHPLSYYEENMEALGITDADLVSLKHEIQSFSNKNITGIKSLHAVELADLLKDHGIRVDKIVVPFIDEDKYKLLSTELKDSYLSLNYSATSHDVIDLSMLDNIEQATSFQKLVMLMKELTHVFE